MGVMLESNLVEGALVIALPQPLAQSRLLLLSFHLLSLVHQTNERVTFRAARYSTCRAVSTAVRAKCY